MLWTEKYRPKTFDKILGQEPSVLQLKSYAANFNLPHLMIIGRSGCGKSTCLDAFSREFYQEFAEENTTIFPVSTMFSQGHAYFSENDRFATLYQKDKSILANFKYIVKWHASLKPLSAEFRLIVFDGADDLSKDAQAALRRIMEKHSRTCRFIFVVNSVSSIIAPIRSRCVPLSFLPIDYDLMRKRLLDILVCEGVLGTISEENLDMLIFCSNGDLRLALVWLELMVLHGVANLAELSDTKTGTLARAVVIACQRGDEDNARKIVENLMIEYGLSGSAVLGLIRQELHDVLTPDTALLLSDADLSICAGSNEYLQINWFVSQLCGELMQS
ncbi:MAG: replication protein C [Methanocalculaceae archaeon]|jgi:replication factor C small subunit|nr:replication protein C [Methanocalculaceae archaeon]